MSRYIWYSLLVMLTTTAAHGASYFVATDQGPHSTSADPRFVKPGCGVFWLRPDSPAIGKGTPEHAPATDFWGRPLPRGKAPDLGAFVFVPCLATEKARIGWHGWPYRFAPQGEMDLSDPWALPPSESPQAFR